MFEAEPAGPRLQPIEIRILKLLKFKALTEKAVAGKAETDPYLVGTVLTDLMLKGYVETFRRRKFYFMHRQYFVITLEGITALEMSKGSIAKILDRVGEKISDAIDDLSRGSPVMRLLAMSAVVAHRAVTRL